MRKSKSQELGLLMVYNDINLVATGSIITVLNAIKVIDKDIQIPYFLRGDGATFMLPASVLKTVEIAIENFNIHILKKLKLTVRVGHMLIEKIYNKGTSIKIAKLKLNKYLTTPVVLCNG